MPDYFVVLEDVFIHQYVISFIFFYFTNCMRLVSFLCQIYNQSDSVAQFLHWNRPWKSTCIWYSLFTFNVNDATQLLSSSYCITLPLLLTRKPISSIDLFSSLVYNICSLCSCSLFLLVSDSSIIPTWNFSILVPSYDHSTFFHYKYRISLHYYNPVILCTVCLSEVNFFISLQEQKLIILY